MSDGQNECGKPYGGGLAFAVLIILFVLFFIFGTYSFIANTVTYATNMTSVHTRY